MARIVADALGVPPTQVCTRGANAAPPIALPGWHEGLLIKGNVAHSVCLVCIKAHAVEGRACP